MDSPFKWDGTSLGTITETSIKKKFVIGKQEFWEISLKGYSTICMVRKIKDATPCIVDEIKTLFGLCKNGSHHVKYGNFIYMIIRCRITQGNTVALEQTLDTFSLDTVKDTSGLVHSIRAIYIFRNILKLGKTNDGNILIRVTKDGVYPISYNEPVIKPEKFIQVASRTKISEVAYKKWFRDDRYGRVDNLNDCLLYTSPSPRDRS